MVLSTTRRVNTKRDLFKTFVSMNVARDHHNRIIHRFIELYMHVHMNGVVISQSNSIANIERPSYNMTRPSLDAFRTFGLISRVCPVITKNQNPILAII